MSTSARRASHPCGHDQQRRAGHRPGPAAQALRGPAAHRTDALWPPCGSARQHKGTEMIGRSHAIHGEPITFGFKIAGWLAKPNATGCAWSGSKPTSPSARSVGPWAPTPTPIPSEGLRDPDHPGHRQHAGDLPDRHVDYVTLALRASRNASPPRSATCSAPTCSKWRRTSPRGKGSLPCPTNQPDPQRTDQRSGRCCATPSQRWRTWPSGTNATSATAPPSG